MMDLDIPRMSGIGLGASGHGVACVDLLDHAEDDDVTGRVDPESGAVHAAPVEIADADCAAAATATPRAAIILPYAL